MNFSEIFQPLVAAYPAHPFSAETAKLYAAMLQDFEERDLRRAVLDHIAESNFFPTVAELRKRAIDGGLSAEREWLEVMRAFRQDDKAELSPEGRAALEGLGGMGYLRYNGAVPTDRAHFFRLYEAAVREREIRERRPAVEALMDGRKALE